MSCNLRKLNFVFSFPLFLFHFFSFPPSVKLFDICFFLIQNSLLITFFFFFCFSSFFSFFSQIPSSLLLLYLLFPFLLLPLFLFLVYPSSSVSPFFYLGHSSSPSSVLFIFSSVPLIYSSPFPFFHYLSFSFFSSTFRFCSFLYFTKRFPLLFSSRLILNPSILLYLFHHRFSLSFLFFRSSTRCYQPFFHLLFLFLSVLLSPLYSRLSFPHFPFSLSFLLIQCVLSSFLYLPFFPSPFYPRLSSFYSSFPLLLFLVCLFMVYLFSCLFHIVHAYIFSCFFFFSF